MLTVRPVLLLVCATMLAEPPAMEDPQQQPQALLGKWTTGRLSMIQYKDAYTGVYRPPTGSHFAYEFHADGTYTFIGLMQSTMYQCTTSLFSQESGRYEMRGDVVALYPRSNPYRSMYSCSPASNREAPGKLVERQYRVRVGGGGAKLELITAESTQVFQRASE